MADHVGHQLGNYRLVSLLGEGGFAEVYLGEHIYLKTQAAIKILQMRLASEDREGFLKEARTIAGLKHPHIIRVLDFGIDIGIPFLVMDYAPHGTLRKRHPKGVPLPLPTIVDYVKQIAPALHYAHERKLVHRDVKPENLLLGEDNEVLLSDFGIALVTQSSRYQSTQEVVGTAAYMAPEQLQGKPRPASDQYALGITVYEWLCGDRPFHGTFPELYSQHLFVAPPSLHDKVPTIPPAVEQVVLTALEKDPHRRFASVQAFATALEQACQLAPSSQVALASEPSPSTDGMSAISPSQPPLSTQVVTPPSPSSLPTEKVTPPSQSFPPPGAAMPFHTSDVSLSSTREAGLSEGIQPSNQPSKRRISRRAVVVGLAGLAIASGGITWLALSQKPQVSSLSASPTTVPAPTATAKPTPTPTPSPTPTPTAIPIGTTFYTYRGHTSTVDAVAWSPDGRRIASGSTDRTVQVWNASDGSSLFTYRGHTSFVSAVAWSPDGRRIASGSLDNTVQVWNASDGSSLFTYRGHTGQVSAVAWSPDGRRIASGDDNVQVWNASDGLLLLTYRGHTGFVEAVAWSPDGNYIASGGGDTTVQVWNASDDSPLLTYRGHTSFVSAVVWSPDSRRIASGIHDSTVVQVWNASDGSSLFTYRGHTSGVFAVAWSPDGRRIASASWDKTVQVWNASDGSSLFTYRGHTSPVWAVAWSPDGRRIASGSADNTVQVWAAG